MSSPCQYRTKTRYVVCVVFEKLLSISRDQSCKTNQYTCYLQFFCVCQPYSIQLSQIPIFLQILKHCCPLPLLAAFICIFLLMLGLTPKEIWRHDDLPQKSLLNGSSPPPPQHQHREMPMWKKSTQRGYACGKGGKRVLPSS